MTRPQSSTMVAGTVDPEKFNHLLRRSRFSSRSMSRPARFMPRRVSEYQAAKLLAVLGDGTG